MAVQLPPEAVPTAIGVLILSLFTLFVGVLLFLLVSAHGEAFSYVALLSLATILATVASIGQQLHTIAEWHDIKQSQFELQAREPGNPELIISGTSTGVDYVFFYIQLYCYNVFSATLACWAGKLALSAYQVQHTKLFGGYGSAVAKTTAVLLPVVVVNVLRLKALQAIPVAFFVVANSVMLLGQLISATLLVVILVKYIKTRRALESWRLHYGERSDMAPSTRRSGSVALEPVQKVIYDRWLVVRFTIAFISIALFQVVTIIFWLSAALDIDKATAAKEPDFSATRAKADFVTFIPGVLPSLVAFIVFGTTKTFRDFVLKRILPKKWRQQRTQASNGERGTSIAMVPPHQRPDQSGPPTPLTFASENHSLQDIETTRVHAGHWKNHPDDELRGWTPLARPNR